MKVNNSPEQEAILEAAARWSLVMARPVIDQRRVTEFDVWLRQSDAHRQAYADVQALLGTVDALSAAPFMTEMRDAALTRTDEPRRYFGFMSRAAALAAGLAVMLCAATLMWLQSAPSPIYYATDAARRSVTLADGSQVTLDRGTRMAVRFDGGKRAIDLTSGQAHFRVAHDTERPFTVTVGQHSVVATGTDFNVDRMPGRSIVTLLKGGVIVYPTNNNSPLPAVMNMFRTPDGTALKPGDQLTSLDDGRSSMAHIDVRNAILWERGKLVFEEEPLGVAVERMNRYNRAKIELDSSVDPTLPISGVFDTGSTEAFANAVARFFQLNSHRRNDGAIVLAGPDA